MLLAPTVNLHRTPIGGRNFECMSEDPYLTARIAVAYVAGCSPRVSPAASSTSSATTPSSSACPSTRAIDERTLRELYLVPFEAAVARGRRDGRDDRATTASTGRGAPTARCSPTCCAASGASTALVMSDWFGTHSTAEARRAPASTSRCPDPRCTAAQALVAASTPARCTATNVSAARAAVLRADRPHGRARRRRSGAGEDPPRRRRRWRSCAVPAAQGMVLLQNVRGRPAWRRSCRSPLAGVRRVAVDRAERARRPDHGRRQCPRDAHRGVTRRSMPSGRGSRRRCRGASTRRGADIHSRLPDTRPASLVRRGCIDIFDEPARARRRAMPPRWCSGTTGIGAADVGERPHRPGSRRPRRSGLRLSHHVHPRCRGRGSSASRASRRLACSIDGVVVARQRRRRRSVVRSSASVAARSSPTCPWRPVATYSLEVEMRHGRPCGMVMGGLNIGALRPSATTCSTTPSEPRPTPTWRSSSSAPTTTGSPRAGTATRSTSPGCRTSWSRRVAAGQPGHRGRRQRRVADHDAVARRRAAGADGVVPRVRRWATRSSTCCSAPSSRRVACPSRSRLRLEDTPAFEHHPGRNGVAQLPRGPTDGSPLVRHRRSRAAVPVRVRPRLRPGTTIGDVVAADPYTVRGHGVERRATATAVEVVQVYAHLVDRIGSPTDEPDQRLVGFAKVRGARRLVAARSRSRSHPDAYRRWDARRSRAWIAAVGRLRIARRPVVARHRAARVEVRV